MATIAEQILAAVKTALLPTAGVDERVYRSTQKAKARGQFPAIVILPDTSEPMLVGDGATRHKLTFRVEFHTVGDEPDALADPIVESAHARLYAAFETGPLGTYVAGLSEGEAEWNFAEGDGDRLQLVKRYDVVFVTAENDLSTLA
jgi:hypothetical protein